MAGRCRDYSGPVSPVLSPTEVLYDLMPGKDAGHTGWCSWISSLTGEICDQTMFHGQHATSLGVCRSQSTPVIATTGTPSGDSTVCVTDPLCDAFQHESRVTIDNMASSRRPDPEMNLTCPGFANTLPDQSCERGFTINPHNAPLPHITQQDVRYHNEAVDLNGGCDYWTYHGQFVYNAQALYAALLPLIQTACRGSWVTARHREMLESRRLWPILCVYLPWFGVNIDLFEFPGAIVGKFIYSDHRRKRDLWDATAWRDELLQELSSTTSDIMFDQYHVLNRFVNSKERRPLGGNPNLQPFPLAEGIPRDDLRSWIEDQQLDTSLSGCAWQVIPLIEFDLGDTMAVFQASLRPWIDQKVPFEHSIGDEGAWTLLPLNVISSDVTTIKQEKIWESRQERQDLNNFDRMRRRRSALAKYFLRKYDYVSHESIAGHLPWADGLQSHWNTFQQLCSE